MEDEGKATRRPEGTQVWKNFKWNFLYLELQLWYIFWYPFHFQMRFMKNKNLGEGLHLWTREQCPWGESNDTRCVWRCFRGRQFGWCFEQWTIRRKLFGWPQYHKSNLQLLSVPKMYSASLGGRAMEEWRPQRFFSDASDQLCKKTEHEANWQQRSILLNFDHLIGKGKWSIGKLCCKLSKHTKEDRTDKVLKSYSRAFCGEKSPRKMRTKFYTVCFCPDVNLGRKRARRTPKPIVAETKPGRRWKLSLKISDNILVNTKNIESIFQTKFLTN